MHRDLWVLVFPVVLLLLLIVASSAQAKPPSQELINACKADAEHVCSYVQLAQAAVSNYNGIVTCFKTHRSQLSEVCKGTLNKYGYK